MKNIPNVWNTVFILGSVRKGTIYWKNQSVGIKLNVWIFLSVVKNVYTLAYW